MARILIDMDQVLVDLLTHWLDVLYMKYKEPLRFHEVTEWDLSLNCKKATSTQVYDCLKIPGFFRHLKPVEGAVESVKKLISDGHDVVIVTACMYGHTDKREWLAEHLPEISANNIIFARRKQIIQGDVFIDDSADNCINYMFENPKAMVICFSQLYNKNFHGLRCASWMKISYLIKQFTREGQTTFV